MPYLAEPQIERTRPGRTQARMLESVASYWNERALTFGNNVRYELDHVRSAWMGILLEQLPETRSGAVDALDLGCGPGFFSILLAELGCAVQACDGSEEMLSQARRNARACGCYGEISLGRADAQDLPFADASFDLVVSRNLTWTLPRPEQAFDEWLRVLRPGGRLVIFDANWYRYLDSDDLATRRRSSQGDVSNKVVAPHSADCLATDEQCRACEEIALQMPLTYRDRPQWDANSLLDRGVSGLSVDTQVWRRVWDEREQAYYSASPLFMVSAIK
jgi:SAM-dependent methyltransferase